jgi:glucose-6-phosphate-specific signal transduction histidine kinase
VLQEAITNIIRHAEARRVAVLLEGSDKEVRMIVDHDGRGFFPANAGSVEMQAKRLEFPGMRERLALVSGTLEVESAPGRGCLLLARLPISNQGQTSFCTLPPFYAWTIDRYEIRKQATSFEYFSRAASSAPGLLRPTLLLL